MSGFIGLDKWHLDQRLRNQFTDGSGNDFQHRGVFTVKQLEALTVIICEAVQLCYNPQPPIQPFPTPEALVEKVLELWIKRLVDHERSEPPAS